MSTASDTGTMGERLFGLLTRAYPADFRQAYGSELFEFFRADRDRAARTSPIGMIGFWARTVTDLLRSAVRQRRARRRDHHRGRRPANRGREFVNSIIQDIRIAARGLASAPGFTIIAILTLAIGISANTTIFSAVEVFMLRPLPYSNSQELVVMYTANAERGWTQADFSVADFMDLRNQSTTADIAGSYWDNFNMADDEGQPERINGMRVSSNFFSVLAAQPVLGRAPTRDEESAGVTPSVVISHGLWNRRYGADPGVIGRLVELDGTMHQIVGVAPPEFWFKSLGIEMWASFNFDEGDLNRATGRFLDPVARSSGSNR